MKQTDNNRIRYEVERQIKEAIDRELDELNIIFVKKANQYHQILFSEESTNIEAETYGPRWVRLREIRQRLQLKEMENWKASGEVTKQKYKNWRRWTNLKKELEEEE